MNTVEELLQSFQQRPDLFFVDLFLREHKNAELFLVGGALRDSLLGRPIGDIDFVVRCIHLDPLITWLQKHGTVDVVGKTFGVIKFKPKRFEDTIDIALPRTEQSHSDSLGGYRDVSVQSDPSLPIKDDLSRRDFTVNAMALNIRSEELVDPFDGQADLENKTLRAVRNPSERFKEDLTRILRGLRFACELDFKIEPQTFEAMKALIPNLNQLSKQDGVSKYVVARETIGDELSKAFVANPSRTVQLLQELGALEELFPSVWRHLQVDVHYLEPITKAGTRPAPTNTLNLEHTIILLLRGLTVDEARTTLSFTGLDTIDKQSTRRLDVEHVLWMIQRLGQHHTPQNIALMRASHFEKQFLGARGIQHMNLLEHLGHSTVADAAKKRREMICANWQCDEHEPIPSLVTGDDVLRQGIPAGARVREILEMVRDQQLDGHILTREAAIRFVSARGGSAFGGKQQME